MRFLTVKSVLLAASLAGLSYAQTKLRIMPLGDSITEITCWRPIVWDNLRSAGLSNNVDFVGSMTNNPQNCQGPSGWDLGHEGHSGYQAINIANNNLPGWLASARPDIVMFMLGTNDVNAVRSTNDIINAFTKMVQQMRSSNPRMRIIVDLVIPLNNARGGGINTLNNAIKTWVSQQSTSNSPIVIADCNTGFTNSMLRDGIHPNAAGDSLIASRIAPVLISQVRSALGTSQTTTSRAATTTTRAVTTTGAATTGNSGSGAPLWGQCGGIGWTGPTTCASGTCKFGNDWYSQCTP